MSMSYTANMRCMSPLDALPVPLVGSNPLLSVGNSTVSVPPARGASEAAPGAVVVGCNWFVGALVAVVVGAPGLVVARGRLDALAVLVVVAPLGDDTGATGVSPGTVVLVLSRGM